MRRLFILLLIAFVLLVPSCSSKNIDTELVGTWIQKTDSINSSLCLEEDGQFNFESEMVTPAGDTDLQEQEGNYSVSEGKITFDVVSGNATVSEPMNVDSDVLLNEVIQSNSEWDFTVNDNGNSLTLTNSDGNSITLTKDTTED